MHVGEVQPIGGGAVGAHEKRQEMLDDFDDQIAKVFFIAGRYPESARVTISDAAGS